MSLSLRRLAAAAPPALVVAGILIACEKPYKPGSPCPAEFSVGMAFCLDSSSALVCGPEKKFANAAVACKGSKGCFGNKPGKLVEVCDFSGAAQDDYCVAADVADCTATERTCSEDKKSMVVCSCAKPARFEVVACRGDKGCATDDAGHVTCDHSAVKEGDACDPVVDPNTHACSADKQMMYACAPSKKWVAARSCKGPKHCVQKGPGAECDSMLADVGDPCDTDGMMGCTVDRGSATLCKLGRFVEAATCHGPSFCQAAPLGNAYKVDCDGLAAAEEKAKEDALRARAGDAGVREGGAR